MPEMRPHPSPTPERFVAGTRPPDQGEGSAAMEPRSEGVQEVLGRIPPWTVRYGISAILLFILLLLGLAALIRYPDTISAPGVLTSADPPRTVLVRNDGKLASIGVQDGQPVAKGQLIAAVESAARAVDIDSLRASLPRLEVVINDERLLVPAMPDLRLGEGQADYDELRNISDELRYWRSEGFRAQRNANLREKIMLYGRLVRSAEAQLSIGRRKQANSISEIRIDSSLASKGVISATDLRKKQNDFMDQEVALSNLGRAADQNRINALELEVQLLELLHADSLHERGLLEGARTRIAALRTFLDGWRLNYGLEAPIAGRVHFKRPLATGQAMKAGTELFAISPPAPVYVFDAAVPTVGAAKIRAGQRAYISLDGYPAQEFGKLIGSVTSVTEVSDAGGYRTMVTLPSSLITSFQRSVAYKPEMKGVAYIITQDRSILGRIIDKLRVVNPP